MDSLLFVCRDMERLYGVRGRRHIAFPATPGCGRGLAASSATTVGASRSGLQSAPPADIEMLLDARVTEVIDPASFWAQIGEGRRQGFHGSTRWLNFCCLRTSVILIHFAEFCW